MKRIINIVLLSVAGTLVLLTLLIGLVGSRRHFNNTKCSGISIELTDSAQRQFIRPAQILSVINKEYGGYLNVPFGSIDLKRMEDILEDHGILDRHDAYLTRDGILHISATQCTPVMKVEHEGQLWYICNGGRHFKVTSDWCKGIPLMKSGAGMNNRKWIGRVAALGSYINSNRKLSENIESMRCSSNGEISIKFRDRSETFIIGQPGETKEKMARIERYRKDIAPLCEEEGKTYKSVNVKYRNQIVCR